MSSEENVETVKRWFDGIRSGDVGVKLWDPELRIDNVELFPIRGPYLGHEGLRSWWEDLSDVLEDPRIEPVEIVAIDDERVLSVQRIVGRFSKTGIEADAKWSAILCFRDGLLLSAAGYGSRDEALDAADAVP